MDSVNFVIKPTLDEERIFTCSPACKECQGACCKNSGCAFSPDDFYVFRNSFSDEERFKYVIAFLKRGYASIDHYTLHNKETGALDTLFNKETSALDISFEMLNCMFSQPEKMIVVSREKLLAGDGGLFLRVRNEGKGVVDICHNAIQTPQRCVLLTENGCQFPFKKRPKGGRFLRPRRFPEGECISVYTEVQAIMDWFPYAEILYKAYLHFQ